jgi:hypothetical protein
MSYRTIVVKGISLYINEQQARLYEQLEQENQELRRQIEKLTLPRVSGTPIDQPVITEVAQVISYLRFWQDNPAPLRTFKDEELSQFFEKIAQQLDDHERAHTVVGIPKDDGNEPEDPDNPSSVRELGGYAEWVNENPHRLPRVWPLLYRCIKTVQGRYEDQSEAESARTSTDQPRPTLVSPEDEPKGKEVVHLPQIPVSQVKPIYQTPEPSREDTPETVIVIPSAKRAGEELEPQHRALPTRRLENLSDLAEARTLVFRLRGSQNTTQQRDGRDLELTLRALDTTQSRELEGDELQFHRDELLRLTAKYEGIAREEFDEVQSDPESVLGDGTPEQRIQRAQRKKASVLRKLRGRRPNKNEARKLSGYDQDIAAQQELLRQRQ